MCFKILVFSMLTVNFNLFRAKIADSRQDLIVQKIGQFFLVGKAEQSSLSFSEHSRIFTVRPAHFFVADRDQNPAGRIYQTEKFFFRYDRPVFRIKFSESVVNQR